jgi:hypothetical protein
MINALMNRSLGKKIEKLIDKSIKTNKSDCERKIDILAKTIVPDDVGITVMQKIRTEYLEAILDDLVDELKIFSDKTYTRFLLAFNSSLSGYNIKNDSFSLGLIYALIYYAYTSEKTKISKFEMLNQYFQNSFMQVVNDLEKTKK